MDLTKLGRSGARSSNLEWFLRRIKSKTQIAQHDDGSEIGSDDSDLSSACRWSSSRVDHAQRESLRQSRSESELDRMLKKYEELLDSRDSILISAPENGNPRAASPERLHAAWRSIPEFGPSRVEADAWITSEGDGRPNFATSPQNMLTEPLRFCLAPGRRLMRYLKRNTVDPHTR